MNIKKIYTFDDEGEEVRFESYKDLAEYICKRGQEEDLVFFADDCEGEVITTFGIYLNKIMPEIRNCLIDVLVPIQTRTEAMVLCQEIFDEVTFRR